MQNTTTKIFLDSGDPTETKLLINTGVLLDGQTTNPSLIVKNPEIIEFLKNQKFTRSELFEKYHAIVMDIRNILPKGDISAEVYADINSSTEDLVLQGKIIAKWFPGVFVKLPITEAGLGAAEILTREGVSVNMTLCFTQEQAAAVHAATKDKSQNTHVYVSPFVGRLDDIGLDGCSLLNNISTMYKNWNSHVDVLGASIRNREHVNFCLKINLSALTAPMKLISEINSSEQSRGTQESSQLVLENISFQELLELPWNQYNIKHQLTDKGLEKFADDWNKICI
jgi:transaldolase